MSKNITIQEGGIGKQLTVDKLKTDLVGGGSCLWVPEDERQLTTKHIAENGTYRASDDGYYGYSEVTVNGVGSVTGRDPTTGEEVEVHRDPTTGEIVETVIPTEIRVIEPPTNPYGVYVNGQTITKDGMVVKAYGANWDELQTVPIDALTISPTIAVYDESKEQRRSGTAASDLIGGTINIYNGQGVVTSTATPTEEEAVVFSALAGSRGIGSTVDAAIRKDGGVRCIVASASAPFDYANVTYQYYESPEGEVEAQYVDDMRSTDGLTYSYGGKTVHYSSMMPPLSSNVYELNFFSASENDSDVGALAWAMVYGNTRITPFGSPQTITVSWPRPGDGKVLETTFEILVAAPDNSEEN